MNDDDYDWPAPAKPAPASPVTRRPPVSPRTSSPGAPPPSKEVPRSPPRSPTSQRASVTPPNKELPVPVRRSDGLAKALPPVPPARTDTSPSGQRKSPRPALSGSATALPSAKVVVPQPVSRYNRLIVAATCGKHRAMHLTFSRLLCAQVIGKCAECGVAEQLGEFATTAEERDDQRAADGQIGAAEGCEVDASKRFRAGALSQGRRFSVAHT